MYNANKTINGLDVETTIADTDELVFGDVSDSNRAKKITFANLKTEITGDDTAFVRNADYDANTILYATTDNTPVALTVGTNSVVGRVAGNITTLAVDSDLTSVSASDDTVPSAKATKTALDLKANDSAVVKLTGDQTVAGVKTFSSDPIIPDEAYGSGWNGVLEPPTKNAVYDKIESLATGTKISIAYTNVTVSNTTTETDLFSTTVPANSLGTSNGVRLRMFLSLKKASTGASFSLRFKYGATTLVTHQINDATTFSTPKKGWVEFVVLATGATGTQEGSAVLNLVEDNQPATSTVVPYCVAGVGTSAIDSTSNQTLSVSVQFGGTSASDEALMYHAILEYIK